MKIFLEICSAVLLVVLVTATSESEDKKKLKVTLFYESLCPDCIEFHKDQLDHTWKSLGKYFYLELVPYGNGYQYYSEGQWHFTCQHGVNECKYNKLHTCAIHQYKSKPKTYINFISCLMQDKQEEEHLDTCAEKYKVNKAKLEKCANSKYGDKLYSAMGNRTQAFQPSIQGVPTIVYNDVYSDQDEDESMSDMPKVVCRYLHNKPKQCHHYIIPSDSDQKNI